VNEQEIDAVANVVQRAVDDATRRTREEFSAAIAAQQKSAPVVVASASEGGDVVDSMVNAVAGLIARSIAPLAARIAELEGRRTMGFCGAHDPQRTYQAGEVVLRQSASWVALAAGNDTPGATAQWRRLGILKADE
jgi:hypothetical protein